MSAGALSDAAGTDRRRTEPVGPGWLVLVVGPSGAGKDTLIAAARPALEGHAHFPTRVITRPPDQTEDSVAVSEEAFATERARGHYALHWQAHGLAYGVPAAIDQLIQAGDTVVVNVSRAIVAEARERYARTCVVLIDASPTIRAARIASRGRENAEAVAGRLARAAASGETLRPDVTIMNDGTVAEASGRLVEAIRDLRA